MTVKCPNTLCDAQGYFPPSQDDPDRLECPACGATWDKDARPEDQGN